MFSRVQSRSQAAALMFLAVAVVTGCAPKELPRRPAENYQGPIAEGPILQVDDYWIYGKTDGSRMKLGAGTLLSKIEFPLWLGRVWKYSDTASMLGGPVTGHRTPVEIECATTAFESISVIAGTFEAFRCKCQCTVSGVGVYEQDCGTWNAWYAPQAKNIVLLKTENTASSAELLEYKVLNRVLPSGATLEKAAPSSAPKNAAAFNKSGDYYRGKGDYDRAITEYSEAIRLNPNYALAFTNRGVTYGRKLDYERAIADYDQAIKLDPKNAGAFNGRGNAHRNKRNYQSALVDYEAAARIDPKLAQHRPMGITLYYLGRMAESAIALERRLKTAPQDTYAILWRYLSVAKDPYWHSNRSSRGRSTLASRRSTRSSVVQRGARTNLG